MTAHRRLSPAVFGHESSPDPVGDDPQNNDSPRGAVSTSLPRVDHHTHIFSPAAAEWLKTNHEIEAYQFDADDLLEVIDAEGIERALVLSAGYFFTSMRTDPNTAGVAAENDWVAQQLVGHSERLAACFSVNPLNADALAEVRRCAATGAFVGLKLHLANSGVDLHDPAHVSALARVLEQAAKAGFGAVVHLRNRGEPYGAEEVEIFLRKILPCAGGAPVQVAHLGGWGGYDRATDEALGALSRAQNLENLYLDVSAVVVAHRDQRHLEELENGDDLAALQWARGKYRRLADHLRAIGLDRVVFGTDWPEFRPLPYAKDLVASCPLKPQELARVFASRTPLVPSGPSRH